MKLDFLSEKIFLFFLLSLSHIYLTQAGTQFSSCVGSDYNTLVSFANNVPDKEVFCCGNNAQCTALSSAGCPLGINTADFQGQCSKIGQSTFCVAWGYYNSLANKSPGNNLCGGVLGTPILTNSTVGTCPSFDAIGNTLSSQSTVPNSFSWLCCDSNSCSVPLNVAINRDASNHYVASTNCQANQYALMCFNDNGGWTCTGSIGSNIPDVTQPIGSCVEQIMGLVPSTSTSTTNSPTSQFTTLATSPTSTSTTSPDNSKSGGGLSGGAIAGISVVASLFTIAGGTITIYKFCHGK